MIFEFLSIIVRPYSSTADPAPAWSFTASADSTLLNGPFEAFSSGMWLLAKDSFTFEAKHLEFTLFVNPGRVAHEPRTNGQRSSNSRMCVFYLFLKDSRH